VKAEAARFRIPSPVRLGAPDERREELEEDRRRAGLAYTARAISDDDFNATIARIEAKLDGLEVAESAIEVKPIDWERWGAKEINAVLRTYWQFVQLDADLKPVRAEWRLPEEYIA
jgi:hypothetical protein